MKILRLGTSQDAVDVRPELTLEYLLKTGLEAEFGEPFEVVTKRAWPTPKLPELLRGWMEEEEPDMVVLGVIGYWFSYPSVPLRLNRRFGKAGVAAGDVGFKMAKKPWLAHRGAFKAGRRFATRLIGGDTYFTPDEVVEVMTACIKEAVKHEGVIVHVTGPSGAVRYGDHSRRAAEKLEARRMRVQDQIVEVCRQYRASIRTFPRPAWLSGEAPKVGGDGLHTGEEGHLHWAPQYVAEIGGAIRAARGMGAGR